MSQLSLQHPFCQGAAWRPRESLEVEGTCGACGKALEGRNRWFCKSPYGEGSYPPTTCRDHYSQNHWWAAARMAAIRRDGRRCVRCGWESPHQWGHGMEVNHINPRNGAGYGNGCHNHQDGLESLCHSCHTIVTTNQRQEREAIYRHQPGLGLG